MSSFTFYPLAFAAGLVSFLSPCVLPLLPGYLTYISGSSTPLLGNEAKSHTGKAFYTTLLFVAGFSLIFSLLGSAFGAIGSFLKDYRGFTQIIAGSVITAMGIFMVGFIKIPWLYREVRLKPRRGLGSIGALPMGMAFAVGWTPCIGPMLASIYMLALSSPAMGASLLFTYSLGLGIPFIVSGVLFSKMTRSLNWLKKHSVVIHKASGIVLIVIGVLLLTGLWVPLVAPLQRYFSPPI